MGVRIHGRWTGLDCGLGRGRQLRLGGAEATAISLRAMEALPLVGAVPIRPVAKNYFVSLFLF